VEVESGSIAFVAAADFGSMETVRLAIPWLASATAGPRFGKLGEDFTEAAMGDDRACPD
jgi:hypothetical protein